METARQRLLVMLFLSIFCASVQGLALHKQSTELKSTENHLADALKVVQREKRRALYDDLGGRRWQDDVNYYDDDDWERPYPIKLPRFDPYDVADVPDLGDLFATDKYGLGDDSDVYRAPVHWSNDNELPEVDGEGDEESDGSTTVSENELEDIFGDSQKEQEKRSKEGNSLLTEALLGPAGKRAGDKREYDPSMDKKNTNSADEMKLSDLSPEQVDILLKAVEEEAKKEMDHTEMADDNNNVTGDDSEVSDDEINDIFSQYGDASESVPIGDVPSGDDDSNEDAEDKTVPVDDDAEDANKEWLVSQYLEGVPDSDVTTTKEKRSDHDAFYNMVESDMSQIDGQDSPADLAMELALAREDIRVLRSFLEQEDAENAHLAHALNLATKSQTERTDKYVPEEVAYIKKAIQDEMDIQEVKDVLHIAASLDDTADGMGAPVEDVSQEDDDLHYLPESMDKRGEPDIFVPDEVDVADPDDVMGDDIASDVTNNGPLDMVDEDVVKALLASKLQNLLRQESLSDLDMSPNQLGGWHDEPLAPSVSEDDKNEEWYLNPLMRELWQKYQSTGSLNKRGYPPQGDPEQDAEYENPMDLDTLEGILVNGLMEQATQEQEVCPAVEQLSKYCSFVTDLGLELDEEAMQLCNRHDMCYTCGSVLDLSPDDCDRGYLEEAVRLCEDKDGCDKDASRLFILMLHYHSYQQSRIPEQCTYQCTRDYIGGSIVEK